MGHTDGGAAGVGSLTALVRGVGPQRRVEEVCEGVMWVLCSLDPKRTLAIVVFFAASGSFRSYFVSTKRVSVVCFFSMPMLPQARAFKLLLVAHEEMRPVNDGHMSL